MINAIFGPIWAFIKARERLHAIYCCVGIVGCLMLYGVLQASERVSPDRFASSIITTRHTLNAIVMSGALAACELSLDSPLISS
jgi:hypothetical protein